MYDSRPVAAEPMARIVRPLAARTAPVPGGTVLPPAPHTGPAARAARASSDDDLIWG